MAFTKQGLVSQATRLCKPMYATSPCYFLLMGPNPLNQMEVSVRTERDQFSTSTISCGSADKAGYKVQKVILGGDEENGPEK